MCFKLRIHLHWYIINSFQLIKESHKLWNQQACDWLFNVPLRVNLLAKLWNSICIMLHHSTLWRHIQVCLIQLASTSKARQRTSVENEPMSVIGQSVLSALQFHNISSANQRLKYCTSGDAIWDLSQPKKTFSALIVWCFYYIWYYHYG